MKSLEQNETEAATETKIPHKKSFIREHLSSIILIGVFLIGLAILLYPSISNYWNSKTQTRAIVDYESLLKRLKPEDYSKLFAEAEKYNEELRKTSYPLLHYDKVEGYQNTLLVGNSGVIGYLNIKKINVELPIYHGVSSSTLNVAVGHLEGTSLPIGGKGVHTVLSAHRGLPSAKLFSNLDKLEAGDTFTIKVLDRLLTYEVNQVKIVKPEEINDISIDNEKDYCTLLTCTPYGINTHRLLVRGIRIENEKAPNYIATEAYMIDSILVAPLVAVPMLIALLVILLVKYNKKKSQAISRKEK